MIEGILGNKTAEKVMLHIYHYGEIHAAGIASDYGIAESQVRKQLERFENANILVSKHIGKARVYFLNAKSAYAKPMKEILRITYNAIPLAERTGMFKVRRRPRRKGKSVL